MRALTLWQPWAQLVAIGAKRVETRGWRPPATLGRLLICAAKRSMNLDADVGADERQRIKAALAIQGYATSSLCSGQAVPLGQAVCVVTVLSFQLTESLSLRLEADELAFGDYRPGRFAWILGDLRPLARPFDVAGRQGLFDVRDDLVAEALRP